MNEKELTELFRRLGAPDPGGWARSQVAEGPPQLYRFVFLRQAWSRVVREDEPGWIDGEISNAESRPSAPYAGVGQALKQLRARGATVEELTDLVRGMQASLLFGLCYLLEDPGQLEDELEDLAWGLFAIDHDGNPSTLAVYTSRCLIQTQQGEKCGRDVRPDNQPLDLTVGCAARRSTARRYRAAVQIRKLSQSPDV